MIGYEDKSKLDTLIDRNDLQSMEYVFNTINSLRRLNSELVSEIVELKDERNDLECQLNEAIGDHNRVLNTLHEWKKRSKHESIIKLISSKISNRYKSIRNKIYKHMINKLNDEGSK